MISGPDIDFPQVFRERLDTTLEAIGWSKVRLAKSLGHHHGVVYRFSNGTNLPNVALLAKTAHLLDVSIDWLLGLDEIPNRK